jgi:hypothetical protein
MIDLITMDTAHVFVLVIAQQSSKEAHDLILVQKRENLVSAKRTWGRDSDEPAARFVPLEVIHPLTRNLERFIALEHLLRGAIT